MRKKNFLLLALSFSLLSCAGKPFSFYYPGELNESPFLYEEKEGYNRVGEFASLSFADKTFSSEYRQIYESKSSAGVAHYALPSLGKQKILVIPVDFVDAPSSSLENNALSYIQEAFFGDKAHCQYESLASYYDQSSYHRFQIAGKVASSWYRHEKSVEELSSISSPSACRNELASIYEKALHWYDLSYPEDPSSNYAFTASDGSKIIPVHFLYSAPYNHEEDGRSSFFWAFTINHPAPICWTSYEMLHLSRGKIDAHTIIHETGHMLGLKDYYHTSSPQLERIAPMGKMDMMDCSLGDHNAFSKMLLGWMRPYVVNSSCEIPLHSLQGNGEAILIAENWNGTPYDEYLLLEFYTPTLLNSVDSSRKRDASLRLFSRPGIKAIHVDARLGYYPSSSDIGGKYASLGMSLGSSRIDIFNNNDIPSLSSLSSCLVQLLDKSSGSSGLSPYYVASTQIKHSGDFQYRDSLFYQGEGFNENSFSDFTFHKNGHPLGYTFKVESLTSLKATISFQEVK